MDVLVGVVSVAMGWGFAWLASKGISFIWPAAEPWVFYWFGGMAAPGGETLLEAVGRKRASRTGHPTESSDPFRCGRRTGLSSAWGGRQDAIPDPPTHASPCLRIQAGQ